MAEGKTPDQIRGIAESLQQGGAKTVLVTRMKPEAVSLMTNHFADEFTYFDISRVGLLGECPNQRVMALLWWLLLAPATCMPPRKRAYRRSPGQPGAAPLRCGGCGASSPACAHG